MTKTPDKFFTLASKQAKGKKKMVRKAGKAIPEVKSEKKGSLVIWEPRPLVSSPIKNVSQVFPPFTLEKRNADEVELVNLASPPKKARVKGEEEVVIAYQKWSPNSDL